MKPSNLRINFVDLSPEDLKAVVVIYTEANGQSDPLASSRIHFTAVYTGEQGTWELLDGPTRCAGTVELADILATKFKCRYVDDSNSKGMLNSAYDGSWEGKSVPCRLWNIEILARKVLREQKLKGK